MSAVVLAEHIAQIWSSRPCAMPGLTRSGAASFQLATSSNAAVEFIEP
jgi:hypothetical protein